MKKLASILGIGVISTAVAFAPAFAQQTKPLDQAGSAIVQTAPEKTPAANQAGKDEKKLPSKPGSGTKAVQPSSAKPGSDVKAAAPSPSAKPAVDAAKDKAVQAKTGSDVKTEAVPGKPDANLKKETPEKSGTHAKAVATPKHHVKKSAGKPASMMHAKAHVSNPATPRTTEKSEPAAPSTGK